MRHAFHTQYESYSHSDRPYGHMPTRPKRNTDSTDRKQQQGVNQTQENIKTRHQTKLRIDRSEKTSHAVTSVFSFVAGVGKELDRHDVGVTVDHTARHLGALISLPT